MNVLNLQPPELLLATVTSCSLPTSCSTLVIAQHTMPPCTTPRGVTFTTPGDAVSRLADLVLAVGVAVHDAIDAVGAVAGRLDAGYLVVRRVALAATTLGRGI